MSAIALKIYYQTKVRVCLDVLEELDRLQNDPGAAGIVRQNAAEAKPQWEREFTMAHAEYDGVRNGMSTLPLPPDDMRLKLGELSDRVEAADQR